MRSQNTIRFGLLILIPVLSGIFAVSGVVSGAGSGEVSGKVIELRENDREALSGLGKGVVGKALPAKPLAGTAGLMPLTEGTWRYQVLAGDDKGRDQKDLIARPKHENRGKSWRRVVGKKCIVYYRVGNEGRIEIVSEADLEHDVITRYMPACQVMFNGMRPGEKIDVETDIKVYDLHDPTDEKYKGRLKVTYTYVGAYEVVVPAGKYRAVLIKSTYKGTVGPASVDDVEYLFYAPGTGVVAAVERSHVSAFLFYNKRTRTPKILLHKKDGVARTR